jgi:hypothetical protein
MKEVIYNIVWNCVAAALFLVGFTATAQGDEVQVPWTFPSPCGLESVTCASGELEVNLEKAVARRLACRKTTSRICRETEEGHVHGPPVCVEESEAEIEAAIAANNWLLSLGEKEREDEASLRQYIAWSLGGRAENYPLSVSTMKLFGYSQKE